MLMWPLGTLVEADDFTDVATLSVPRLAPVLGSGFQARLDARG